MTSVFEAILVLEVAVGTIYFTFFMSYFSLHAGGLPVNKGERNLLLFTMIYIMSVITILCIFLYLSYIPGNENYILGTTKLGLFIGAFWFTMFLVFIQATMIYKKLS